MHVFSVGNDEIWSEKEGQSQHQKQEHFLEKNKKFRQHRYGLQKVLKVLNIAEVPCIKLRGLFDLLAVRNYTTISSTTVGTSLTHLDRKNWTPMNQQYTLGRPQIFLNDLWGFLNWTF